MADSKFASRRSLEIPEDIERYPEKILRYITRTIEQMRRFPILFNETDMSMQTLPPGIKELFDGATARNSDLITAIAEVAWWLEKAAFRQQAPVTDIIGHAVAMQGFRNDLLDFNDKVADLYRMWEREFTRIYREENPEKIRARRQERDLIQQELGVMETILVELVPATNAIKCLNEKLVGSLIGIELCQKCDSIQQGIKDRKDRLVEIIDEIGILCEKQAAGAVLAKNLGISGPVN